MRPSIASPPSDDASSSGTTAATPSSGVTHGRLPLAASSSANRGCTDQVATRSSYSVRSLPPAHRRAGAHRAQQGVARGVLALDELHDVDAVALEPQQRGPQRVGHGVREPLAQDAVPGQRGVRRRRLLLAQLRGDVVVAAGRGEHQPGSPADGARQRLVGRGVAGVQRQHDVGRLGQASRRGSCRPRTPSPRRAGRRARGRSARCARATARARRPRSAGPAARARCRGTAAPRS